MGRQAWTSKESELAMIFRSDWGNLALQESGKNWIEQHQKPPWRDLVYSGSCGEPPAKAKPPRAKAARKLRERSASRSSRESRGESRYILVEAHLNIHVHHYLRAIFRESNCERYYETPVTAKAKTVRAKEPRKPSRKLIRIRTKSLPGFQRRSIEISEQERRCFGLRIFFWNWECLGLTNISKNML